MSNTELKSTISRAGSELFQKARELVRPEIARFSTGLHIGKQNIILSEFEIKKDETILLNLTHEKTAASSDRNLELLTRLYAKEGYEFQHVAVSVPRESAVVRIITFPLMDEKQLKTSLEFEAEKYVPFNLSEIYFDCQSLMGKEQRSGMRQMKVLLAACKRDVIMGLIQQIQKARGQVDAINLDSLATLNAFLRTQAKEPLPSSALLDIGTNVSNLSLMENNQIVFLRDISFGGADLSQTLTKNLQISADEAEAVKTGVQAGTAPYEPLLRAVIEKIIHEVKITIHYVEGQLGKPMNMKQLHLAGGMARNPLLQESIRNLLGLEPVIWDPLKGVKIASWVNADLVKEFETVLPVSVGLALS
ncbi:MAG: type IV pilus assembly protein PilM [Candidatus Omnitrophica bacterium]|nr:type IV pilus assembly protein PilM [Candidatus Omnitrophota bacterium]